MIIHKSIAVVWHITKKMSTAPECPKCYYYDFPISGGEPEVLVVSPGSYTHDAELATTANFNPSVCYGVLSKSEKAILLAASSQNKHKFTEGEKKVLQALVRDEEALEKSDFAEIKRFSDIVGLSSSIVDSYRHAFPSRCVHGVPCMRHADIPGLPRSLKFNTNKCSALKVKKANIEKRIHHTKMESVSQDFQRLAPTGKTPFRSPQENLVFDVRTQLETDSVSHIRGNSSRHDTKVYYTKFSSLIAAVTPLLHAQAFHKIVHMVDPYLAKTPQDKEYVPLYFISGLSHFKLVNYKEAQSRFINGDNICVTIGKLGDSALCNLYLGDIKFSSRHYQEASTYYHDATLRYSPDTVASLFRMVPPSLSAVHAKHGSALRNASKMVDAIQEYKLAIKEAKTEKDKLAANTSLGNLYQSLGENSSALTHYEQSVEISQNLHDYVSLGWAHGNMGNAYLGLFQKDKALCHLQKSLDLTVEHEPTPQAIGRAYNNLGTAYQSLGDLDKAKEMYQLAHDQATYGNDKAGKARVCGNMGNVLMLCKNYEEAVAHYGDVLSLSKDRSTLSTAHHNRGCAYYEWGESKLDQEYGDQVGLKSAPEGTKSIDGITPSTIMEAKYYIHGPGFEDMIELRPRRIGSIIQKFFIDGREDLEEVVKYHETHLDNIKGSSKGLTLSVSLFETNSRTFHRLQDCLVNLGKYYQALLVAEQSRARTLGELMLKRKGWCLQDPFSSPMSFEQILTCLDSIQHPVLYLSYTGARLIGWIFISKEDGDIAVNMFEVPLKDDQFDGKSFDYHLRYSLTEALVERSFEMYREVGDYNEDISAPVQTLYNLIAKPLLTILTKYKADKSHKIIVITDSYTALLPFSSLHNCEEDTFLGDSYCFQLMPSFLTMSILNQLSDINVVHLPTDSQNMCIVGNPNIPQFKYNDEVWNLGKLPHAKKEAESVAYIMKTTPILEGQATKSAVLMRIMSSKIIHLATHGSASAGFLAFGMLVPLGQDRAASAQGVLLYPEEVEKLNISPALVVLSSCDSGRGAVKADGIQGMARAFILAGAQAVLTTLWRVPDESAAIFMQFFYQYMMDGLESTKALQKAILSIRCFSKYSQYIHWSGYQLTGRDIYLQYTVPEIVHSLEKALGKSNVFPRLQDIKLLETGLVEATCYPTDVQIIQGTPGLDAHEIAIDFIHNSYKQFTGGIFWINCEQAEFVTGSLKYIEKIINGSLETLQLSELKQCLVVLDGMTELPQSESLQKFMANRHTHCIILYHSYHPPDNLIRSIDHKLLRGCKVHHLEPLSMILSSQRIVYSIQKATHFCPKSKDQATIERISNSTSGSPILVNIAARLLSSYFSNPSSDALNELLQEFVASVDISQNPNDISETYSSRSPSPTSTSTTLSTSPQRHLSSHMSTLSSISVLSPECRDEWDTPGSYDSWDSITGLLNACQFDTETRLLLNCMSHLGCGPIPVHIVSSLSTLITETSGNAHLAGSLLTQLMNKGFVKLYPSPVVFHDRLKQEIGMEFVYVPKYVGDYMLKNLDHQNKTMTLAICFHTLSHLTLPYEDFIDGLLNSLIVLFEINADVIGETCYGELYRLCLSQLHTAH